MATVAQNREKLKRLGQEDLYFFSKAILGFDLMVPHVQGRLCRFLQYNPATKKQVTLSRGFLKTTTGSIADPVWRILPAREEYEKAGKPDPWHNPNERMLIVQNIIDNAMTRINTIKGVFEKNEVFRALYPEIIPDVFTRRWSDEQAQIKRTEIHPEATFEAAGVNTSVVSRHYTRIIEDDIIAAKKDDLSVENAIPSEEDIAKAIGFHRGVVTLLVDQRTGVVLNIGTRWAKNDVIQYIRDNQMPPYVCFEMSARGKDGQPTYPERFPEDVLIGLKHELGLYLYMSQYENEPMSSEDMVFNPDWMKEYETAPKNPLVLMSVDPACRKNRRSDYTVIMVVGVTWDHKVYVLEYVHKKLSPSETVEEIFGVANRWNPETIWIETVGYQYMLKETFQNEMVARGDQWMVEEYNPENEKKEARIRGLQPIAFRGELYMRPHHKELRQQLLNFPDPTMKDDIMDALAILGKKIRYPTKPVEEQTPDPEYLFENILQELRRKSGRLRLGVENHILTRQMVKDLMGVR